MSDILAEICSVKRELIAQRKNTVPESELLSRARLESVLANEAGPCRDIVVLNAAAALYVSGVAGSLWDGVALARDALASGAARGKLDQLVKFTRGFAPAR